MVWETAQARNPICSIGMGTLFSDEGERSTVSVSVQQFVLKYRDCTYNDMNAVPAYIDTYYLGSQTYTVVWMHYPYENIVNTEDIPQNTHYIFPDFYIFLLNFYCWPLLEKGYWITFLFGQETL